MSRARSRLTRQADRLRRYFGIGDLSTSPAASTVYTVVAAALMLSVILVGVADVDNPVAIITIAVVVVLVAAALAVRRR